jgi:hypothetical protein
MSWHDVPVGPNLAAYNYARRTAKLATSSAEPALVDYNWTYRDP